MYDLPSMEALVRYMHAAAGFPVRSTWLNTIKNGNFNSWPGLTYNNAAKYCPQSIETMKGHMVQYSQGVRSTKRMEKKVHNNQMEKVQHQSNTEDSMPNQKTQEIHIWDHPISKLYTYDCGRFPIRSRSGNKYIMIAYHCDSNTTLQAPFVNRKDKHRIRAYSPRS